MTKREGNYVPGPGREPLYDEDMVKWQVYVPESFREYIKQQAKKEGLSSNAYLRRLIAQDMANQQED